MVSPKNGDTRGESPPAPPLATPLFFTVSRFTKIFRLHGLRFHIPATNDKNEDTKPIVYSVSFSIFLVYSSLHTYNTN